MNFSVLKIILILIVLGGLVFYPLYVAKAVSGWLIVTKEFVLDLIARVIGRVLMSILGNKVTGVILHSGREGGPAFVRDWRQFMQRAQYRGEDVTRATIFDAIRANSGTICEYLRNPLGSAFGAKEVKNFQAFAFRLDSLLPYKTRNRCTLPAGFDVNTFRNDFSAGGGWAAWDKLIQPQNNFYGVFADSLDELGKQRGFEEKQDTNEAGSGSGYTSRRTGCDGEGENKQCTILGKVVTPADIFGKTGAETINKEFAWLFSTDEIQEALVSLAGMVVSRLTNFVDDKTNFSEDQNNLGPGTSETPPPPGVLGGAEQDCIESCIATYCQPQLPACVYITVVTGEDENGNPIEQQVPANSPCDPADSAQRNACISNCQAQGCGKGNPL